MKEWKSKFGVLCQQINEQAEQLFCEFWGNFPPELIELRDEVFSVTGKKAQKKTPSIIWQHTISEPFAEHLGAIADGTYGVARRKPYAFAPLEENIPRVCIHEFSIPFLGFRPTFLGTPYCGAPDEIQIKALELHIKPLAAYVESYFGWEIVTTHNYHCGDSAIRVFLSFS